MRHDDLVIFNLKNSTQYTVCMSKYHTQSISQNCYFKMFETFIIMQVHVYILFILFTIDNSIHYNATENYLNVDYYCNQDIAPMKKIMNQMYMSYFLTTWLLVQN